MQLTDTSRYLSFLETCYQNPVVLVEISSACNFQCKYCISRAKAREKCFMPENLFERIVYQLPQITPYPIRLHVDGEPTLHPKFHEYGKLLNRLNIPFVIATNGSRLSRDLLDLRMEVVISISTDAREFRERTAHMDYDEYLEGIADYLRGWSASDSMQSIYIQIPYYRWKTNQKYSDEKEEFIHRLEKRLGIEKCVWESFTKPNGHRLLNYKWTINECQIYRTKSLFDRRTKKGFCSAPWEQLAILADGRVSFCCMDLTGGTAFTTKEEIWSHSLLELWSDNRLTAVRKSFRDRKVEMKVCQRCLADQPDHSLHYLCHGQRFQTEPTPKNEELFPMDSLGCPRSGQNLDSSVPLKPYKYGSNIDFGKGGNYLEYPENGWSQPEAGFTWTDGHSASLTLPIEKPDSDVELRVMLSPFIVPGKLERQRVNISIDDNQIGQWVITNPKPSLRQRIGNTLDPARRFQEQAVTIHRNLLRGSIMTITFQLPDATAPAKLTGSGDERILGIAIRRITLNTLNTNPTKG